MTDVPIVPAPELLRMAMAPVPNTRADVDKLATAVVTAATSGDGMEAGFKTTEFWLTVIAVVVDFAGPHFGIAIPDNERMLVAGALVAAYGGFRSWRKRGGAAYEFGYILSGLADIRKAVSAPPLG